MKNLQISLRGPIGLLQIVAGTTFVISGLTKANDPLGMTLLLQNYLTMAGIHTDPGSTWVTYMVLLLALIETLIGALVLVGLHRGKAAGVYTITMVMMTLLTLFTTITDSVPECGCFGSALSLTNAQSLLKNVVLLATGVLLVRYNKCMYVAFTPAIRSLKVQAACILVVALGLWSWHNLPLVDFTPYKVGTDINAAMMGEYEVQNGQSIEIKEPTIRDFALIDAQGEDATDAILCSEDTVVLVTVPYESNADVGNADRLNKIWDSARDSKMSIYLVMSQDEEAARHFRDRTGLTCPTLYASIEMLETIVRANPGLVYIHKGRIVKKFSVKSL